MYYVIGAFLIIVGGILWWVRAQRVIGLNPTSLTIQKDTSGTFTVQLMYKPWFKRTFKPISGTITSTAPPSIVQVNPASVSTNSAGGRIATITVNAAASGTGKIIVNGTSRKGTHDTAKVSVTVP